MEFGQVKRRESITLLGGAATWPLAARAQQTRVPTIGVLALGIPDPEPFLKALRDGLRDRSYSEGRNIRLEIRAAEAAKAANLRAAAP
jgi:putative ABC transport system substrate-binding protein